MKQFPLSTPRERIPGVIFSILMCLCLIALPFVLRENLPILIFTVFAVVLIVACLVIYVVSVMRAACIPDAANKKLLVRGLQDYTLDLTNAVTLETVEVKNHHTTTRALVFRDAEGETVGRVPTYFTSKMGALAEPMAMELAKELGLEFKSNVPKWEYDEQARAEHEKEVEQQEKEAAAARKKAKKSFREAKMRKKMEEIRKEKK